MFLKKYIFVIFLLILGVSILSCTSNEETRNEGKDLSATIPVTRAVVVENKATIPVVRSTPTVDGGLFDPESFTPEFPLKSLDDINCAGLQGEIEEESY